jgi:ABC-type nitrate/sulfonate/bicarbonate transport system permease component
VNAAVRTNPFGTSVWTRAGWVALAVYVIYAASRLVGAGGIGMALDTALNLFQWDRVAMVLFAIFAVVILAEVAVTTIRKRVI